MRSLAWLLSCSLLAAAVSASPAVPKRVLEDRLQRVEKSNPSRLRALERMFRSVGCTPARQAVPGSDLPNLICTLQGKTDRRILVTAHFDMLGPGLGVGDNWASTSLLPSFFEALRAGENQHTFLFIGFTDEEKGLVGSRHYAAMLNPEERSRIDAVVNMDGVGMASTQVWASRADGRLLRLLREVAREEKLPVGVVNLDGAGMMDSFPFDDRGIPTISLHGLAQGTFGIPHSRYDQLTAVNIEHLHDSYRLLLRYLAVLDRTAPHAEPSAGGNDR